MEQIKKWLETRKKDYQEGVQLYASSPGSNSRILKQLERSKNSRNLSLLIRELRKVKVASARPAAPEKLPPKPKPKPAVKPSVQVEIERKEIANQSASKYFKQVRYGDLPKELRPRFRKLKDLLYEMNELKFVLNELPAKEQSAALEIQLQIESLDEEKDLIWREIDHWQNHKTLLPTKTDTDFKKIPPHLLAVKKANLKSSISKISARIEGWEKRLETLENNSEKIKTSQQINRSQQKLHKHELNLIQINQLLHE